MPYRIKTGEPLRKAMRRIVREQLTRSAKGLKESDDHAAAVHDARKGLKRARALLRLVRAGVAPDAFQRANHRLRDIARGLSGTRDRDVLDAVLATIAADKGPAAAAAARLRTILAETAFEANESRPELHASAASELLAAVAAIARLKIAAAAPDVVAAGLAACHRAGRRALRAVLADPDTEEHSHELRKAAQTHWRQMLLLQVIWPEALKARALRAKQVADLLGEDHDLALLDRLLAGPMGDKLTAADRRALAAWSKRRHAKLKAEALPAAAVLFAERPGDFARRISDLWADAQRRANDQVRAGTGAKAAEEPSSNSQSVAAGLAAVSPPVVETQEATVAGDRRARTLRNRRPRSSQRRQRGSGSALDR